MDEAAKFDVRFAGFQNFAIELTADFFAQHYPGGDLTNVGSNYESFRRHIGEIIKLIETTFPKYFVQPPTN